MSSDFLKIPYAVCGIDKAYDLKLRYFAIIRTVICIIDYFRLSLLMNFKFQLSSVFMDFYVLNFSFAFFITFKL